MTEVVTAASQAAGAGAREAHPGFEVYDPEFAAALGPAPRLALVAETDAHEGPVYIPGEDALYFTTLPRQRDTPAPGTPHARHQAARARRAQLPRAIPPGCRSCRRLSICPTG